MRFCLLAPLDRRAVAPELSSRELAHSDGTRTRQVGDGTVLRSRLDHRASEFEQRWHPLEVLGDHGAVIEDAWLVTERDQDVVVLLVVLDGVHADVVALETRLADVTESVMAATPLLAERQPLWVNRTLLASDGLTLEGWIDEPPTTIAVASGDSTIGLELAWGNNRISGWSSRLPAPEQISDPPDAVRWQILRGLVDSQVLWCELEAMSAQSAKLVAELSASARGRAPRGTAAARQLRRTSRTAETLFAEIASHRLAYDDLLFNLQGPRRVAVEATLREWRYDDLLERVGRRLGDLKEVLGERRSSLERRYQRLVEGVLTALSLLALIDLVVSFISLANAGTDAVAGDHSPFRIFSTLREVDADVLVLQTGGVILLVILFFLALRRRA